MRATREGRRFTRLVVLRNTGKNRYDVRCDCGAERNVHWMNLLKGLTKSCGCLARELAEARRASKPPKEPRGPNMTDHPLHSIWHGMKARCGDPGNAAWKYYGGRGIRVCPEWQDNFWAFVDYMPPRPEGTTIDRIDNDGHYEPGNVRWATPLEQAYNRSNNVHVGPHSPLPPWPSTQFREVPLTGWMREFFGPVGYVE